MPFMDLSRQHAPLMGEFRAAFERVVRANAFILGEEVEQFEQRFAGYCRATHCIGVANTLMPTRFSESAIAPGAGQKIGAFHHRTVSGTPGT